VDIRRRQAVAAVTPHRPVAVATLAVGAVAIVVAVADMVAEAGGK
jgi:hypothetical protein